MKAKTKRVKKSRLPSMALKEVAVEYRVIGHSPSPYRLIDLFAGAGGLTVGFTWLCGEKFQPVWTNDFNRYAAEIYNLNFGNAYGGI